jgi:GNAT superfamily N-acetyltransferase
MVLGAPRGTYRPLGGPSRPEEEEERIWSLVCFFIKRELRGEGMTTQLIQAAAALARSKGAQILEAYPVDPNSPSYRFMGYFATFESGLSARRAGGLTAPCHAA